MRKAINSNPIVQVGLLGLLGLIAAVFMLSGGGEPPVEETTPESAADTSPATATPAAPAPATGTAPATELVPGADVAGTPFEAGKGLPAPVVNAHESGDVVVLLVMQDGGIEDEPVERDVRSLEQRGDTSVFVTESKRVSKYSRIAEGVTLDRVPAIIVVHPLESKLADGEAPPVPAASVSYGYRGEESVVQAVEDALYDGESGAYSP